MTRERWPCMSAALPQPVYDKLALALTMAMDLLQMTGFSGSTRALTIDAWELIASNAILDLQREIGEVIDDHPWRRLRWQVFERDHFRCLVCDRTHADRGGPAMLHCHHVTPRSKGGKDLLENLATVCLACHDRIHHGSGLSWQEAKQIIEAKLS